MRTPDTPDAEQTERAANTPAHERALVALLLAIKDMVAPHLTGPVTPPQMTAKISNPIPTHAIPLPDGTPPVTGADAVPVQQVHRSTPRENHPHPTRRV